MKNKKVKIIKKPIPPEKTVVERRSVRYDFNWVSKKVAWEGFQAWAKEKIPTAATDVTLELLEEWEYDDCYTSLELSWNEVIPNPRYEKEMKKYKKGMIKWKRS